MGRDVFKFQTLTSLTLVLSQSMLIEENPDLEKVAMKICSVCGRVIEPRKKWAKNWDEIKFCSEKCRRNKKTVQYETQILELLKSRGADKTICPSEVLPDHLKQDKNVMESVRSSARILASQGKIVFTQKGQVVDPSTAKGPIRLKLVSRD